MYFFTTKPNKLFIMTENKNLKSQVHSDMNVTNIHSKTSHTMKIMTIVSGVIIWTAYSALRLLWKELTEDYIITQVFTFVVVLLVLLAGLMGIKFKISNDRVEIKNPYGFGTKKTLNTQDISLAVVKNSFWGKCLTIYYGNNQKATIYPNNLQEVVSYMKSRNIEVR